MSATRPVGELREIAKKAILEKLSMISVAQASRDLGVTRQAIYGFKKGDYCPSLALIERACKTWSMEFNIDQGAIRLTVSKDSFTSHPIELVSRPAQQLSLDHLWKQLENRPMTVVKAEKTAGTLEMILRISIPA
jgi:DNA-binding XRE family transcriptional regulator